MPIVATALLAVAALALPAVQSSAQTRVPCPEVLSELHAAERRGVLRGGDPGRIAERLGTSKGWVQRCADVYGRRLETREPAKRRIAQERTWESQEPEEVAIEELETEDDVVFDPRLYRDKARQRAFAREALGWKPYEHRPWRLDAGDPWSPYLYDPHRTESADVPGLIRD